jgi:hypothetical protein
LISVARARKAILALLLRDCRTHHAALAGENYNDAIASRILCTPQGAPHNIISCCISLILYEICTAHNATETMHALICIPGPAAMLLGALQGMLLPGANDNVQALHCCSPAACGSPCPAGNQLASGVALAALEGLLRSAATEASGTAVTLTHAGRQQPCPPPPGAHHPRPLAGGALHALHLEAGRGGVPRLLHSRVPVDASQDFEIRATSVGSLSGLSRRPAQRSCLRASLVLQENKETAIPCPSCTVLTQELSRI